MSEADIRAERVKKLGILKKAGMEGYPAHSDRDTAAVDFQTNFEKSEKNGRALTLAGRLMSLRGQGGIIFADLYDGTGRLQLVLQKEDMDATLFTLWSEAVDVGDFVEATGTAYVTKRGEKSLKVSKWKMLAKSLLPIPDTWFGLKDEELVLRQRYLDILLKEDVRKMFERRAKFWQAIRDFYLNRGFLEVESPILENMPGGADARPFVTHYNALGIDVYLRISLELWHKRLLVAGFPKVFEIGRVFRNEGQSREHLQDFTFIESYEAYSDIAKGKKFLQDLYRHIAKEVYGKFTFEIGEHTIDLAEEWPEINFTEVMQKEFDINPLTATEKEIMHAASRAGAEDVENKERGIDYLWKKIRKSIAGPAFLVGTPAYLTPLAKRKSDNPDLVERIQIIMGGSEVGNGYGELNDPQDQRARFEEQEKLRAAGDEEAQRLDNDFVRAMEYGMPPAFGFGVSERLFAFLENKPAHEAQLFPLLKPKQ